MLTETFKRQNMKKQKNNNVIDDFGRNNIALLDEYTRRDYVGRTTTFEKGTKGYLLTPHEIDQMPISDDEKAALIEKLDNAIGWDRYLVSIRNFVIPVEKADYIII